MDQNKDLHPIIKQLEPSPDQVDPILSRDKDIVVTAGAGTGKTRTLVARYLGLLAEGIPLRSIIAITFTKKAAREMRNRVREEVRKFILNEDLPQQERAYWRYVYEALDGARISTIHSLAGDILRQHPAELGLDPGFETLDESESARLKALAVEAALSWAGSDKLASGLFSTFGAWKLRPLLGSLLNKRLDVAAALEKAADDLWPVWQPLLVEPLRAFIEDPVVRAGLEGLASLQADGTLERAQEAGDLLVDDLRIVINSWEKIKEFSQAEDWIQVSRAVGPLGKHLKQKGKTQNWEPANPKAVIKEIQKVFEERIGRTEIDLAVDKQLASEVVPALRGIFQYADRWYADAREQINGLDFDDLEEKVLYLLEAYPEVLRYWQGQIQALLVDEYQDTNDRQRELVNSLNGAEGGLFIVGDGKQSIYRFRGADVAVFRQEQKRVSAAGESYHLDRSYRSHPALLDSINSLLAPVLGDRDDLPYLEPFAKLSAGRESSARIDLPAYVEFHLTLGSKSAGAGRKAAEAVASRLLALVGSHTTGNPGQGLTYGDVAVLCRASSSFTDFEQAFDSAGIPYTTVSGQGFYDRPEIRDLLNALQAFEDPGDDLALAGLMRSPVIGFPDQLLLDVRDFQQEKALGSLLESAREYPAGGEDGSGPLLRNLIELVDEFSALAGRVTVAELISRFLARTAYSAGLALAGQERAVGNLRKLVLDAQTSAIVNLSDFLDLIEEIRNVAIREGEAQSVAQGAVQIMTVHQAKGLEFPIVVLGDATKRDRMPREILIDDEFGLIPPFSIQYVEEDPQGRPAVLSGMSSAYEIALERERLKEEAETKRLLYVGATRAQDLLLVSGAIGNPTKDGKLPSLGGWMGELIIPLGLENWEPVLDPDGSGVHHQRIERGDLKAQLSLYERLFDFGLQAQPGVEKAVPAVLSNPGRIWNELDQSLEPEGLEEISFKPIYPASKSGRSPQIPSRVIGEVVHKALELWKFPEDSEADFLDWIEVEFKTKGAYRPPAVKAGYRRVREILERFAASELYQRMARAETLLHEIPFHLEGGNHTLHSGTMDALFKEGEEWILVEFKTDQVKAGKEINWEDVDYLAQVAGYLEAAERILGQRPQPVLCFLDHGGRVKLITDRWG